MKKYYPIVDILRVLAMFCIVGCHLDLRNMTHGAWLINYYADIGVGIFGALAGYFFFGSSSGYELGFGEYLKKRTSRLVLPYLKWTVVFVLFSNIFHIWSRGTWDHDLLDPRRVADILFLGSSATQLWFIICLFYIQCLIFPTRRLIKRSFAVAWIVAAGAVLASADILSGWYARYPLRLLGFVMIGGWMACLRGVVPGKWQYGVALLSFLVGFIFYPEMMGYRFSGSLLMVVPLCWLALQYATPMEHLSKSLGAIRKAGNMMLTVYFVHPLITVFLREIVTRIVHGQQNAFVFLLDQITAFAFSVAFALLADWFMAVWQRKSRRQ